MCLAIMFCPKIHTQNHQDSKIMLDNLSNEIINSSKSQSSSNERVNQLKHYLNE